MKRSVAIAGVVLVVALAAVVASRMRGTAAIPDLAGDWKSWRSEFRVSRDGDRYRIVVTNPDGFLGGTYFGTPHGSVLVVAGPLAALCGRIEYVKEGDKLQFCGEEFEHVDRPAKRISATPSPDDRRRGVS